MKYYPRNRTINVFQKKQAPLVAKVGHLNGDCLRTSMEEAVMLLGGFERAFRRGDRVLIKPNFNCAYAMPLSTDLCFLGAAIEILLDLGAVVRVGEHTGGGDDWPPERIFRHLGVDRLLRRYGVPLIDFRKDDWLEMEVDGLYWDRFRVPRSIYQAEKRLYLANMRAHSSARYTSSLKLSVGWLNTEDRRQRLHEDRNRVEFRIADLNLGWQPDLVLTDGRRSTVGWHGRGEYVFPNVIMASGDMVAIDTEAVKLLKSYPAENHLQVPLSKIGQLVTAQELGLGSMQYELRSAGPKLRTEEEGVVMMNGEEHKGILPLCNCLEDEIAASRARRSDCRKMTSETK